MVLSVAERPQSNRYRVLARICKALSVQVEDYGLKDCWGAIADAVASGAWYQLIVIGELIGSAWIGKTDLVSRFQPQCHLPL